MNDQVLTTVIELVADQVNRAPSEIRVQDKLNGDLWLDSLDGLELQMTVEDTFDIHVPDERWQRCVTVRDIATLAQELHDAKHADP